MLGPHVRLASRCALSFVVVEEQLAKYHRREYVRMMLQNNRSIVASTLLLGLSGTKRVLWRRPIQSVLFYRATVERDKQADPVSGSLLRSLLERPMPTFQSIRFETPDAERTGRQ